MKKHSIILLLIALTICLLTFTLVSCFGSEEDKFVYALSEDESYYTITGNNIGTFEKDIVIPSEYDGKPVKAIAKHAFYACHNIESVSIPSSVVYIGDCAFMDCKLLKSIDIPDTLVAFGMSVFEGCYNFKMNEYDNAKYVGNDSNPYIVLVEATHASIPSCEIHKDTKVLAAGAFNICKELKHLHIGENIVGIGYYLKDYVTESDEETEISFKNCEGWVLKSNPADEGGTEVEKLNASVFDGDELYENAKKLLVDFDSYYWILTKK